jgi:hypothetical protein
MALRAIWQFMDRDVTHKILYYFVGDRPVHKLPFCPKCHELFVILYSRLANLSDGMFFCYCIYKAKNEFGQNPEENIILTGSLTKKNRENINVKIMIKTLISNLVRLILFWNNLHQVQSISKYWKTK